VLPLDMSVLQVTFAASKVSVLRQPCVASGRVSPTGAYAPWTCLSV
jgi:hypothetical protein